mmetsp:Transcript_11934/g.16701  ORF Transcript_11934/g.16701 Transcript_11934/m.16701 type:complete len:110 (-) Transcript_11934:877-1206(-)
MYPPRVRKIYDVQCILKNHSQLQLLFWHRKKKRKSIEDDSCSVFSSELSPEFGSSMRHSRTRTAVRAGCCNAFSSNYQRGDGCVGRLPQCTGTPSAFSYRPACNVDPPY